MAEKPGTCPICLNYFGGLAEHHIIPREMTLNGTKGINGPTVYLCSSCHDLLHRSAKSDIAQTGKQYYTAEQRSRASPYLKVLIAATIANEHAEDTGQTMKVVLNFTKNQMEKLHALKIDHNASNLAEFIQSIVLSFVNKRR